MSNLISMWASEVYEFQIPLFDAVTFFDIRHLYDERNEIFFKNWSNRMN